MLLPDATIKHSPVAMAVGYDAGFKYYLYVKFINRQFGMPAIHKLYKFSNVTDRENVIARLQVDKTVDYFVSLESEPF